jgi:Cu/Ag efflux pump CusA
LRSIIDACVRFRLLVVAIAAVIMVTGIGRLTAMPVDTLPATSPAATASPVSPAGDLMLIGVPSGRRRMASLSALAAGTIAPRLRRLPGVSAVSAYGAGGQVRGEPGVVLVVREKPATGVLAADREVDQALAAMAPALRGVSVDASLFREDTYARSALANLRVALVASGALIALALIALLLQLRIAFTALFGMALSLVAATAVLDLLGYTFNAVVALGLLLALALVATEAACEAAAIASRIGAGEALAVRPSRMVAAACGNLRGALTAAGLSALLCMLPLLLATGRTASFLRPMAVAYVLAVVAALVIAVTVTPALAATLLTIVPPAAHGTPLSRLLAAGYTRAVGAVAGAPRLGAACAAACVALGVAGLALLPSLHAGQPTFSDRALVATLTGPRGTSPAKMDQMTALASGELLALRAVRDVGATINGRASELWVTLDNEAAYGQAVAAVDAIASRVPSLAGAVSTSEAHGMAGVLTGPRREPVGTRIAFIVYVIAAIAGVLLLAMAATGNWRLALIAFGSLPVSLAGGVITAVALGAAGELAATAGLLAVFAIAARQAIAVTARTSARREDTDSAPGLAAILTPALITVVAMAPFAAMGAVPGMELLRTAATVILGGLVTTTLASLFVLPAVVRRAAGIPV